MSDDEISIPPEAVRDACILLGVGEFESSPLRGDPDFATALERKYPMKVWRAAAKRAVALASTLARQHTDACDAREKAGLDRVEILAPVQAWLDLQDVKKPGAPVTVAGQKPRIATRPI